MSVIVKPESFNDLVAMSATPQPMLVTLNAKDLKPFNAELISHFASLPEESRTYGNFRILLSQQSFLDHKNMDPENFNWQTIGLVGALASDSDKLKAIKHLKTEESFTNHQCDNHSDYNNLITAFATVISDQEGKLAGKFGNYAPRKDSLKNTRLNADQQTAGIVIDDPKPGKT